MRKIFKKVVAAVASVAMLAGLVALPAVEAKAGNACGGEKNIYVSVPSGTEYVGINIWHGLDAGTAASCTGNYTYAKAMTKVQDGLFVIKGTMYDDFNQNASTNPDWDGIDVILINDAEGSSDSGKYTSKGGDGTGQSANFVDITDALLSETATDVWLEVVIVDSTTYTIKVGSPVTITATDEEIAQVAIDKIDAALALDATIENKAAYDAAKAAYDGLTDAQKAYVDTTKLASLNAKIDEIQAAIDAANAAAAGKLVIYVQNFQDWEGMNLYSWNGGTEFFGAWPGSAMTACEKNTGWYSAQFDITAPANIIFNYDGAQTENIENVAKGTYWYTIAEEDGKLVATASTTAPEGWVEEAAKDIEVVNPLPTDDTNNTSGTSDTPAAETGDATPFTVAVVALVAMGAAVLVLNTKKANR